MPAWAILATKIAAGLLVVVGVVAALLLLSLSKSDSAQDRVTTVGKEAEVTNDRLRSNRELILANRELVRNIRGLERQNRRTLKRLGRLLIQARIAKPGRGGLRITEAARGRAGETGATGQAGARGATGAAAVAALLNEMALQAALIPLLPAALIAICGGDCRAPTPADGRDGRDASPVTKDMVIEAVRVVCAEVGCDRPGPPGPQGPAGEPAPPAPCDPALGYVCRPDPMMLAP